jgi:hypothetical protein
VDEEHDIEMDVGENAKEGLKEDKAGDAAEKPTQAKDEMLDKMPVVVLTPDPAVDAKVELKAKDDEPEEEAKPKVEVCSFSFCTVCL